MLGKAQFPLFIQQRSLCGARQEEAAARSDLLSRLVSRANYPHIKGGFFSILIDILFNIMSVALFRPEVYLTQNPAPTVANRMRFPEKGDKKQFLARMIFPII